MRLKVEVTTDDIRLGKRDGRFCPITRGLKRSLREFGVSGTGVFSGQSLLWIGDDETLPTPGRVKDFIRTFDEQGKKAVKPFSFTLNIRKSLLESHR